MQRLPNRKSKRFGGTARRLRFLLKSPREKMIYIFWWAGWPQSFDDFCDWLGNMGISFCPEANPRVRWGCSSAGHATSLCLSPAFRAGPKAKGKRLTTVVLVVLGVVAWIPCHLKVQIKSPVRWFDLVCDVHFLL